MVGDIEDLSQVTIADGLKSLCPTEMPGNKPPRRADFKVVFKWLSTFS